MVGGTMHDCLPGKRVLVVEDNPVIAFDIDDALRDVGAEVVGPALDLTSGLRLARAEGQELDGAVLDIDLRGEMVWPLAQLLRNEDIPVVFVSADCRDPLPEAFRDTHCLSKPAPSATIIATVAEALQPE